MVELPYSSVTPKSVYFTRRRFLAGASAALGFASGISFANTKLNAVKSPCSTTEKLQQFLRVRNRKGRSGS
jgi:hypothetical protein